MLYVDKKYASIFGTLYLEKYKVKTNNPYLSTFRCPECGDSQKNQNKTRGYLFEADNGLISKCHNCGHTSSFQNLLLRYAPNLYEEYSLERFREKNEVLPIEKWEERIESNPIRRLNKFDPFKDLKKISQLCKDHVARKYVDGRKIAENHHHGIYYTESYTNLVNSITKNKFKEPLSNKDEERIIFPLINEKGYVFGFVGRSINKDSSLRYLTEIFVESEKKIYGLDRVDRTRIIKVVEGPIDSLCLDNAVALCGTEGDVDYIAEKSKMVIVIDNQPRNKEVVSKVKSLIDNDYQVVIWPEDYTFKDINEAIMSGMTKKEIETIIKKNTVSGLQAQIRFVNWKKIKI